jgi:ATP-dependent helicase/nuclease subunit B
MNQFININLELMIANPKIYNIPANYKFIQSFTQWVLNNHKNLNDLKIFLPNQRLCRELKNNLGKNKINHTNFIKIKAIKDINLEDFYDFLPNIFIEKIIDDISIIKVLNPLDAIFLIIDFISCEEYFKNQNFTQKFKIAKNLYNLFNDIEIEEINIKNLIEFDDSNLPKHHQFTLDFFIKFLTKIKNHLIENDMMFIEQYHNFIINKYCESIKINNKKQNIVIAGSTGSVASSKKLIKAIFEYENGYLFISGYKYHQNCKEIHPQFYLNELIKFISPNSHIHISDYIIDNLQTSSNIRNEFNELIFCDYTNYELTINKINKINKAELIKDIKNNLEIIEAKNEIIEAKIIENICCDNNNKNLKIGIISNNNNLTNKIKLNFDIKNINYNYSISKNILNNEIIDFIVILYKLKNNLDFDSHSFLSLIKHPLFIKFYNEEIIYNFEVEILRSDRIDPQISGIYNKINETLYKDKFLLFFEKIINNLPKNNSIKSYIESIECFADSTIETILSKYIFGEDLYKFLNIILNKNFIINCEDDIKIIFSEINYFEKSKYLSSIDILSPIEARLLEFDLIILASCNEDDFPALETSSWIGSKIKKELKVNKNLKKIGQNGFDLYHYLSCKKIIITHTNNKLGNKFVESPFITKIKTLSKFFSINIDKTQDFKLNFDNDLSINRILIKSPQPKVLKEHLPKKLNITDISKIISNPYYIYSQKILKLVELKKINFESSYAEYGSFVHKVLEEFIIKSNENHDNFDQFFIQEIDKIFAIYFKSQNSKLIWLPKFLKIFPNFVQDNSEFLGCQNLLEEKINIIINDIEISGKIDRVIINDKNEGFIMDYKTGKSPSKNDVYNGKEPQLLIYSYILNSFIHEKHNITKLCYWEVNNKKSSKIKIIVEELSKIIEFNNITEKNLKKIIDVFYNSKNIFYNTLIENDDYIQNLSRIKEWKN